MDYGYGYDYDNAHDYGDDYGYDILWLWLWQLWYFTLVLLPMGIQKWIVESFMETTQKMVGKVI